MTSIHTQGPWAIYVPKSLSNDDMVYGIDTNNGINSESVVLFSGGILKKEDARLIAAAPDLLEALSKLTEMYCQMVHSGDCGNWNPEDDIEIQEARAAIAKATENSP